MGRSQAAIRPTARLELPANKGLRQLLCIHARQLGARTPGNHLASQRRRGLPPKRKERLKPGRPQLGFPVRPDVGQKEVAKCDGVHTLAHRTPADALHPLFVHFVGARPRSGTIHSGSPAAFACASNTDRRVLCIATRSNSVLSVASRPTMSQSPRWRRRWSVHALSLPLLHDTRTRFMQAL